MKKTTILISPSGDRQVREAVFREIISLCPDNDYSRILYLGPNSFILEAVRERFLDYFRSVTKRSAYIPFQCLTIRQLAAGLHDAYAAEGIISDRMKTLILCEKLGERSIGYARLLAGLLEKIRHYTAGRDIARLKDEIRHLIFDEKAAGRAMEALETLRAYEDELKEKNLIDHEGVLKNSIALLRDKFNAPASAFRAEAVVVDGFFDPTPLELEFIRAVIDKSPKAWLLAEEDTGILKYFRADADAVTVRKAKGRARRGNAGYYSYASMEQEVEGIARNVKKLILNGLKPWEITVCFPVLSKYIHMTRRIFRKYGIPLSVAEYDLSGEQPFMAIGDMIACIEGDYSRNDFLAFLTSPYFPGIPPVVRDRAVSYAYAAGIVKGKDRWLSIRETILNSAQDGITGDDRGRLDEFQAELNRIINIMEDIRRKQDIASFADAFEAALDSLGFSRGPDIHGAAPAAEAVLQRVGRSLSELRRFAALCGPGDKGPGEPVFYLKYLLQDLKGSDTDREGVKLVPFELAAGIETGALFFGGMLEGDFPSRPGIDPILPERVKKALGMPHLEYYLDRQKSYFRRLLNVSSVEPFFSCPSSDGDNILLPSPFLDWAAGMKPPEPGIFTAEDVLIREGAAGRRRPGTEVFRGGKTFFSGEARAALRRLAGGAAKGFFSVTGIDYYRKCPLRFYIEKVLGLEMQRPPKFRVEARLWGTLAHRTMEYLFKHGDTEPEALEKKIFEGLDKSLEEFPIGVFWSRVAREIFQKLLPLLKAQEADIRRQGFTPRIVEKDIQAEISGLALRGLIDRVDFRTYDAQDAGRVTVSLLDYKTGTPDADSLQLPLYAAMWRKNFPEPVERVGYYSLKEGRVRWYPKRTGMEEFVQDAVRKAEEIAQGIRNGVFPAEPARETECRYCCHSPLCRGGARRPGNYAAARGTDKTDKKKDLRNSASP